MAVPTNLEGGDVGAGSADISSDAVPKADAATKAAAPEKPVAQATGSGSVAAEKSVDAAADATDNAEDADEEEELQEYLEESTTIFEDVEDENRYLRRRGDVLARGLLKLRQVATEVVEDLQGKLRQAEGDLAYWRVEAQELRKQIAAAAPPACESGASASADTASRKDQVGWRGQAESGGIGTPGLDRSAQPQEGAEAAAAEAQRAPSVIQTADEVPSQAPRNQQDPIPADASVEQASTAANAQEIVEEPAPKTPPRPMAKSRRESWQPAAAREALQHNSIRPTTASPETWWSTSDPPASSESAVVAATAHALLATAAAIAKQVEAIAPQSPTAVRHIPVPAQIVTPPSPHGAASVGGYSSAPILSPPHSQWPPAVSAASTPPRGCSDWHRSHPSSPASSVVSASTAHTAATVPCSMVPPSMRSAAVSKRAGLGSPSASAGAGMAKKSCDVGRGSTAGGPPLPRGLALGEPTRRGMTSAGNSDASSDISASTATTTKSAPRKVAWQWPSKKRAPPQPQQQQPAKPSCTSSPQRSLPAAADTVVAARPCAVPTSAFSSPMRTATRSGMGASGGRGYASSQSPHRLVPRTLHFPAPEATTFGANGGSCTSSLSSLARPCIPPTSAALERAEQENRAPQWQTSACSPGRVAKSEALDRLLQKGRELLGTSAPDNELPTGGTTAKIGAPSMCSPQRLASSPSPAEGPSHPQR